VPGLACQASRHRSLRPEQAGQISAAVSARQDAVDGCAANDGQLDSAWESEDDFGHRS